METLRLAHFYAHESEQFAFFRIPKLLFSDNRYKPLSGDAKILYGLMLDRMSLSVKNGWADEDSRVFIYYPLDKACSDLNRSINTLTNLFKELANIGLIIKKRQGQGRPDMIYVMNFASGASTEGSFTKSVNPESQDVGIQIHKNCESRITESVNPVSQDFGNKNHKNCESHIRKNKTENNKTEIIKTAPQKRRDEGSEEEEMEFPIIDRDELLRLSERIVSPEHAAILADEVLEAYRLYWHDSANKSIRHLHKADAAVLAGFVSEVARMDLGHVGNLTAYLKRVLADYLRKNSLRGIKPVRQKSDSSYDLDEIQAWLDSGGDLP